jgi:glycerol-3-phosphate responsive antiterminator
MPKQVFRLQITDLNGEVIELKPGGKLEIDFIEACTNEITAHGVGVFKTEAQVRAAIKAGISNVIRTLKHRTIEAI